VVVPDKQLSLAIGKEGQNARLAAKLTGWRIDIKSATEAAEEALRKVSQEEIMRQATAKDRDILVVAEAILKEKEGTTLSDGELQTLSRAIRAVDEAEATLEKERAISGVRAKEEIEPSAEEVQAPEALAGEEQIDLLAQAEALLTAKAVSVEAAEAPAAEVEAEAAGEVAVAEPEAVAPVEAAAPEAVEVAQAPAAEAEAEVVPQVAVEPELELVPAVELEWVEEEEEEDELGPGKKGKKKGRGKKRELVFDENLGEVIARRKRKPGRQRGEWDEEF